MVSLTGDFRLVDFKVRTTSILMFRDDVRHMLEQVDMWDLPRAYIPAVQTPR
jgi:hypothetical protein